jgi:hypothetical protein
MPEAPPVKQKPSYTTDTTYTTGTIQVEVIVMLIDDLLAAGSKKGCCVRKAPILGKKGEGLSMGTALPSNAELLGNHPGKRRRPVVIVVGGALWLMPLLWGNRWGREGPWCLRLCLSRLRRRLRKGLRRRGLKRRRRSKGLKRRRRSKGLRRRGLRKGLRCRGRRCSNRDSHVCSTSIAPDAVFSQCGLLLLRCETTKEKVELCIQDIEGIIGKDGHALCFKDLARNEGSAHVIRCDGAECNNPAMHGLRANVSLRIIVHKALEPDESSLEPLEAAIKEGEGEQISTVNV